MSYRRLATGISAFLGMLILILDGKTALAGAQEGIGLCLKTVIPSLFPFFILSNILNTALTGSRFSVLHPLTKIFPVPDGCEALLISSFLGGYPTGAQSIVQAYNTGLISKQDAERLLAYGNLSGPSFIFGVTSHFFPEQWMVWALWGIHILSAVVTAQFVGIPYSSCSVKKMQSTASGTSLKNALSAMELVCGWVVFFRSIIHVLKRWILCFFPEKYMILTVGILELTNGCCELSGFTGIEERFIVCSSLLAFGGVCVFLQTAAVARGLSMGHYIFGKFSQTTLSVLFSCCLMYKLWIPAVLPLLIVLVKKKRNNGSIPRLVGV